MSNPSIEFLEFPDSGSLTANRTYVIRKDHTVTSSSATMPENVTLIFMGGILSPSGSITLTGNRTRIIASAEQIFATSLNVGGTWEIERAYPQWFGAKSYASLSSSIIDSAAAINKAILMKGTGEVLIPRGYYRIDSTIEVKSGIVLTGELGGRPRDGVSWGTALVAGSSSLSSYTDGYFMRVNVSGSSWAKEFPDPGTTVKNLVFLNDWKNVANLKGMCTAGSFEVNTCFWFYFKQVIKNLFVYSDLRKIVNCTFNGAGNIHSGDPLYAFDLDSLGDALIFEHNGIHDTATTSKALHVVMCNGGTISSNIINNDVLIEGSKGIVYSSNHMEAGAQLVINDANVTTMNNFFQKGTRPSLVVKSASNGHAPVVKSSGDLFLFYDKEVSDTSSYDIDTISEYDVQVSNRCSLEFSQSYRYWVLSGSITAMYIFGIAVCDDSGNPVTDFNEQSYLLSSEGRIMSGLHVMNSAYINNLLVPTAYGYGPIPYTKWHLNSGNYYYKYQILWDKKRRIVGNSGNFTWESGSSVSLTKNSNGILFHLANSPASCGNQAMLRVYRGTSSSSYSQYIDIPLTGSVYLYDNGISVCGFKWKTLTSTENITSANTNIVSIRYKGNKIECEAPSAPSYGTWQEGDIVYNTSTSGSTALWIYSGGAWRAR
jgi:hypothetical protein